MTEPDAVERAARVLGALAQRDVPLGPLTTYRVGGPAALFVAAASERDLELARDAVSTTAIPVVVIGKGSNLLVADSGWGGLALTLTGGFASVDVVEGARVRTGGATALPVVARRTAAAALTGFEWAVGVPGSVGGAVRMNAGGHGSDMAASLVEARVVDLSGRGPLDGDVPVARLRLGYRTSALEPAHVVVSALLQLAPGDAAASEAEITEIVRWRRENQPGGQNAGSVFTNPPDDSAGRLIDLAGMKGHRVGSAYVSPKHANFFQADEGGSADDVMRLIDEVRRQVLEVTGVELHPELRLVGFE